MKAEEICKCGAGGIAMHPCPYRSDVNDDEDTLCNCCEGCTTECAEDI